MGDLCFVILRDEERSWIGKGGDRRVWEGGREGGVFV